ncbi:DMT family transporter [Sinanaerobacter sp. ZZT-01]|uniref:DMT family transporter n=1 Tax=Sinanaerobacter sp. ZZT-01 TaxID=3111540 RepID=UPI002D7811A4|nr:EamA family transporter [Sinanaerobacter sp. ZZT-01]WRR94417.1 EamA family transporter [Sinanaerobacter sp. ZZT-01]
MIQKTKHTGYGMIFLAGSLWGTIGLFASLLHGMGAASSLIAFLRLFIGFLVLIPIMLKMGGMKLFSIDKKSLFFCFLMGIFSQALYNFFYTEALESIGMVTASMLLYMAPIFVCVMAVIFFKENMGSEKVIAVAVNVIGCALVVTGGNISALNLSGYGIFAGIMAAFLYALMTVFAKKLSGTCEPVTIIFYSFLFGWVAMALIGHPWQHLALLLDWKFAFTALAYGLIPTVGAYLFYIKGLSTGLEASKVSMIASVETIVGALIGVLFLNETTGLIKVLGVSFVLTSLLIMEFPKDTSLSPDLKDRIEKGMVN